MNLAERAYALKQGPFPVPTGPAHRSAGPWAVRPPQTKRADPQGAHSRSWDDHEQGHYRQA